MTHPSFPTPAAPKRRRWITPTIAVGTLVAGFAIGAGASGVATAEVPEPEVITETEIVYETENIYTVPEACLAALDDARAGFTLASEMMAVMGPGIEAAYYRDVTGMEIATALLDEIRTDLNLLDFPAMAAACEAAA